MLVYIDDICVNGNLVLTAHVRKYLSDYGFVGKDPEWVQDDAKVFGMQVWRKEWDHRDESVEVKSQTWLLLHDKICRKPKKFPGKYHKRTSQLWKGKYELPIITNGSYKCSNLSHCHEHKHGTYDLYFI